MFQRLAKPQTGKLEYMAFSAVGLDKSVLLSPANLKKCFDAIDMDSDGKIGADDLRLAFGETPD